jgi:LCP family protein required for cell wall assembly
MSHEDSRHTLMKLKRKNKKKKFFLTTLFISLFVIIGVTVTYGYSTWNKAANVVSDSYESDGRDKGSSLREPEFELDENNISILFIGVDQGGKRKINDRGLSDALILATLNKTDKSVNMVNIPRDSYVYVPYRDEYTKITHAHAYGGTKAAIETVENLFEVPVDYYMTINFNAFIDVVDTVGGIDVNVPFEMHELDSKDRKEAIHLLPGEQTLDGEEALAFVRSRKYDNDLERGKRQQEALQALLKEALSFNSVLNISQLIDAVGQNLKTNIPFNQMAALSTEFISPKLTIETIPLEGRDLITDLYYYELDEMHLEEVKQELKQHLGLQESLTPNNDEIDNQLDQENGV